MHPLDHVPCSPSVVPPSVDGVIHARDDLAWMGSTAWSTGAQGGLGVWSCAELLDRDIVADENID